MPATACKLSDVYLSPLSAYSAGAVPASRERADRMDEADERNQSCAKGVMIALGLEMGAVMLVCATWLGWHLIR